MLGAYECRCRVKEMEICINPTLTLTLTQRDMMVEAIKQTDLFAKFMPQRPVGHVKAPFVTWGVQGRRVLDKDVAC